MQPRPSFDRALLIPIAVGLVSLLGIGWILSTGDLKESLSPPTATPTAIPLDDGALETKISSFFPSVTPTLEEMLPTATEIGSAETLPSTDTSMTASLLPPSATPTPERIQPLRAGTYDDMDPNIAYDRSWTVLKNPGTKNAYKGTLHVSSGIGNEASFRFTGERFILGYQRGKNFGIVTVMIDDKPYSFHEQAADLLWRSPQLPPGDHFVRIIHESGEWINLDYIEILDERQAASTETN
jgi:hypothetical protein